MRRFEIGRCHWHAADVVDPFAELDVTEGQQIAGSAHRRGASSRERQVVGGVQRYLAKRRGQSRALHDGTRIDIEPAAHRQRHRVHRRAGRVERDPVIAPTRRENGEHGAGSGIDERRAQVQVAGDAQLAAVRAGIRESTKAQFTTCIEGGGGYTADHTVAGELDEITADIELSKT